MKVIGHVQISGKPFFFPLNFACSYISNYFFCHNIIHSHLQCLILCSKTFEICLKFNWSVITSISNVTYNAMKKTNTINILLILLLISFASIHAKNIDVCHRRRQFFLKMFRLCKAVPTNLSNVKKLLIRLQRY